MSFDKLIVGLGNPGSGYEKTRHNVGFLTLRHLADQNQLSLRRSRHGRGLMAIGEIAQQRCGLLLPMAYMNNSGKPVFDILEYYNIDLERLLVVCDDFHLGFGQIRLRLNGSSGGHNGLASVIQEVGSKEFSRVRMGIGSPRANQDPADFVLEDFTKSEQKDLDSFIQEAAECCLMWISQRHQEAMNRYNKRKKGNE